VVEVAEDDEDSASFGAEGVLNRYFDIVEGDKSGTSGRGLYGVRRQVKKQQQDYGSHS